MNGMDVGLMDIYSALLGAGFLVLVLQSQGRGRNKKMLKRNRTFFSSSVQLASTSMRGTLQYSSMGFQSRFILLVTLMPPRLGPSHDARARKPPDPVQWTDTKGGRVRSENYSRSLYLHVRT